MAGTFVVLSILNCKVNARLMQGYGKVNARLV